MREMLRQIIYAYIYSPLDTVFAQGAAGDGYRRAADIGVGGEGGSLPLF